MLKAKVKNRIVEFDDNGEYEADRELFILVEQNKRKTIDTSQGMITTGTKDLLSLIVLLDLIDTDFTIISGDEDAHLYKRLIQEGDVLFN